MACFHRMRFAIGIASVVLGVAHALQGFQSPHIFFCHAFPRTSTIKISAVSQKRPPVVIFPGFGNDQIDYISPLGQSEEVGLQSVLERRGFDVSIVPVKRLDWFRVAAGLFDPAFWIAQQRPGGIAYGW